MDTPNEIILQILKLLEKSDLKSVRLVSKTWTAFAAELLFDQVYVSAHSENLEVFSAITQHPLLSQYIKTLRYDAVDFISTWGKGHYLAHLWLQSKFHFRHNPVSSTEPPTLDPEINTWVKLVTANHAQSVNNCSKHPWKKCKNYDFICDGYRKYQRCAALQRAQFSNGVFLETLVGGLQKLRNLSCVIVGDRWSLPQRVLNDPKGLFLKIPTGSPLARDWNIFHTCPKEWDFKTEQYDESMLIRGATDGADHYWTITGALIRSQRSIKTFKVGDDFSSGVPPYVFDRSRVGSLSFPGLEIVAFSGLQVLKLRIAAYGRQKTPESHPSMEGLRFLLGSMHHLRLLDLDFPEYHEDEPACYSYNQVFPQDGRWSQLTSLSLCSFASSAVDFLTLITRRAPKLSHLKLGTIDLLSETWEGVFECMMQSRHLMSCELNHETQFWHRGATGFFFRKHAPESFDIEVYVEDGGRHPCLRSDEPDSAAQNYITEDLKPFCKVLRAD